MAALLCTRAVGQPGGRRAVARRRRTAARPDSLHGAVCGVLQQGLRSTSPPPSQGRRTRGPARGRRLGRRATPEDGRCRGARREPWREVRPVGSGYTGRCVGPWSRSGPCGRDPGCSRRGPGHAVGCPRAEKAGDRRRGRAGSGGIPRHSDQRRSRRQPVRVRDQLLLQVHPDCAGPRGRRRPHDGSTARRSQRAAAGIASCCRPLRSWLHLEGVSAAKVHRRACPQPIRPTVAAHGSCPALTNRPNPGPTHDVRPSCR